MLPMEAAEKEKTTCSLVPQVLASIHESTVHENSEPCGLTSSAEAPQHHNPVVGSSKARRIVVPVVPGAGSGEQLIDVIAAPSASFSAAGSIRLLRTNLKAFVRNTFFDFTICMCILLNAVNIGASAEHQVQNPESDSTTFQVIETIFGVIFTIELFLKIFAMGRDFLIEPDWKWNVFDSTLVFFQLTDMVLEEVLKDHQGNSMQQNVNLMRLLRVLRLLRILRLVRVVRFFTDLRMMIVSLASSLRPALYVLLLLFLFIYTVSVFLLILISDNPSSLDNPDLRPHFGSLLECILSLYKAMTGGIDWGDLQQPLVEEISPMMALLFSVYIAFTVLCMLNTITGVFVNSALRSAERSQERETQGMINAVFRGADADGDNTISWKEFFEALTDEKNVASMKSVDMDVDDAKGLFALIDTKGIGEIPLDEFVSGFLRLQGQARFKDVATLTYSNKRMSVWLRDRIDELESALKRRLEVLTDQDLEQNSPKNRKSDCSLVGGAFEEFKDLAREKLETMRTDQPSVLLTRRSSSPAIYQIPTRRSSSLAIFQKPHPFSIA